VQPGDLSLPARLHGVHEALILARRRHDAGQVQAVVGRDPEAVEALVAHDLDQWRAVDGNVLVEAK